MAQIYNEQPVLGIRLVADGTEMHNQQPVIGVRDASSGLFSDNLRTLGVAVLDADQPIYNDQPVLGAVLIDDGRDLYNDAPIVPAYAVSGSLQGVLTPQNWDVIYFGDSRMSDSVTSDPSLASGYLATSYNYGPGGWLPPLSGDKLRHGRYPGFGIGGNTSAQAAAVPRLDATGAASAGRWDRPTGNFASNKGAPDAAAHDAGIVVLLIGTNDATTATTEANTVTIMDNIGSSKLIILLNETPRGINPDGSGSAVANAAARYTLSRELLKYDFDSGDAKARSNVIAVNSFDAIVNPATVPAAPVNIAGTLRDGVHFTPAGAKAVGQAVIDRLSAVYGATWAALPRQGLLPTANGLTTPADTQPFVNTNPILTPGTNGSVSGTWAVAPLASGVPQGWSLNGTTVTGISCIATKGVDTDPDGFPALKLELSGTIAAGAAPLINILQIVAAPAEIAAGRLTINDKLRATARIKVAAGSQGLFYVQPRLFINDATANRRQTVRCGFGGGTANAEIKVGTWDAGDGEWRDYLTELADMQDPNLVAISQNVTSLTNLQMYVEINFRNFTGAPIPISATVWISRAGVYRVL